MIKEFNEFNPDSSEVRKWEEIIKDNYPIYTWKEDKYISISDKTYFLTGHLHNKGRLTDKIFIDIKDDYPEVHDPSLRKAIRNWINKNSGNVINESSLNDEDKYEIIDNGKTYSTFKSLFQHAGFNINYTPPLLQNGTNGKIIKIWDSENTNGLLSGRIKIAQFLSDKGDTIFIRPDGLMKYEKEQINIEMYFENLLDDCDYAIESYKIEKKFKYTTRNETQIVYVMFKNSFLKKREYDYKGYFCFTKEEVMNFWPNIISLITQFRNLGLKVNLRYSPELDFMKFEISENE